MSKWNSESSYAARKEAPEDDEETFMFSKTPELTTDDGGFYPECIMRTRVEIEDSTISLVEETWIFHKPTSVWILKDVESWYMGGANYAMSVSEALAKAANKLK